jgi:hypothetical protein
VIGDDACSGLVLVGNGQVIGAVLGLERGVKAIDILAARVSSHDHSGGI